MEPFEDRELSEILREWEAPGAPATLRERVLPARQTLWRWMVTGTVRVPVPAAAALLLLALWLYADRSVRAPVTESQPGTEPGPVASLADFRPVDRVELRIVGEVK
jgi:hypothetical protein